MSACCMEAFQVQHMSTEKHGLSCSQAYLLQYSSPAHCSQWYVLRLSVSSVLMLMYRVSRYICPAQLKL